MKTYVIGHKNPDTDSVVSAIALTFLEHALSRPFQAVAARAGELNKETLYVLKRFAQDIPVFIPSGDKKVILVDHNEPSHISDMIQLSEIQCIIDHHKLGGLSLSEPISVRTKVVGSTATIIAGIFREEGVEIPTDIAGVLLAGIISDTLNFTSPTTTDKDKEIASKLNEIAQVNLDEVANAMFDAKSDISDIGTEELLSKDYKVFDMAEKKVGIGVWETVNTKTIIDRKQEIMEKLSKLKQKDALDYVYFAAVDILAGDSELFILDQYAGDVARKAFGQEEVDNIMHLPNVVSRKKQITPRVEAALRG